jgi:hypothetical protein
LLKTALFKTPVLTVRIIVECLCFSKCLISLLLSESKVFTLSSVASMTLASAMVASNVHLTVNPPPTWIYPMQILLYA